MTHEYHPLLSGVHTQAEGGDVTEYGLGTELTPLHIPEHTFQNTHSTAHH